MDCPLVSFVFLVIFLSKANNQHQINDFRDQPYANMDLKAFENTDSHYSHLSIEDKKKILNYLKSFTSPRKETAQQIKILENPSKYCKSFRSCKECARSKWYPCGWCHNYGCTHQPDKLCTYAMTRMDVANTTTEELKKLCPYIEHQGSILIPAGIRHNLQVKIHATDPVLYEKEIICQLHFSNRVTYLKALILDDIVYCYPVTLDTSAQGETNVGLLRLIWGGVHPFSNKIPISVYRCESLAGDCESCRMIPPEYGCGWCGEKNKCVIADKCEDLLMWNVNRLTCRSLGKKMLYL